MFDEKINADIVRSVKSINETLCRYRHIIVRILNYWTDINIQSKHTDKNIADNNLKHGA